MLPAELQAMRFPEDGNLPTYDEDGTPIAYLCADGGYLCPGCANENLDRILDADPEYPDDDQWRVIDWQPLNIPYLDENKICDHCYVRIMSI